MKYETKLDACREWVRGFNAFPYNMIEKLISSDYGSWTEITPPTKHDSVYVDDYGSGEIIEIYENDDGEKFVKVELYYGSNSDEEYVEVSINDVNIEHNDFLPMWGTLWQFDDSCDDWWIENNLDKMAECGFRIYESYEFGYFFGIDGAGYDFYESHWIPLYDARGLHWHKSE